MNVRTIFAASVAALSLAIGAQAARAENFQSGLRMMTVPAPEPIEVALFYPTRAPATAWKLGPFAPTVAMGAAPAEKVKGLILLSHGTGGSELGHYNLAQTLAQQGYLVAAPRHPRDNWQDRSLIGTAAYFSERPRQLSRVLDALLADEQWKDRITAGRIGAIGHSAGGYSVLALAGGIADPRRLVSHCGAQTDDAGFCAFGKKPAPGGNDGAAPVLNASDFDVMDKRIRAVVAMAPVGIVFAPESLPRIAVPVKIIAAEKDAVLKAKYHGAWLKEQVSQAEYEDVENAGHFAFMAPMNMDIRTPGGNPNDNPPGFDRAAFHQRLEQDVTAFFDRHLQ